MRLSICDHHLLEALVQPGGKTPPAIQRRRRGDLSRGSRAVTWPGEVDLRVNLGHVSQISRGSDASGGNRGAVGVAAYFIEVGDRDLLLGTPGGCNRGPRRPHACCPAAPPCRGEYPAHRTRPSRRKMGWPRSAPGGGRVDPTARSRAEQSGKRETAGLAINGSRGPWWPGGTGAHESFSTPGRSPSSAQVYLCGRPSSPIQPPGLLTSVYSWPPAC